MDGHVLAGDGVIEWAVSSAWEGGSGVRVVGHVIWGWRGNLRVQVAIAAAPRLPPFLSFLCCVAHDPCAHAWFMARERFAVRERMAATLISSRELPDMFQVLRGTLGGWSSVSDISVTNWESLIRYALLC